MVFGVKKYCGYLQREWSDSTKLQGGEYLNEKDLLMFATRSLLLIAPIFTTEKKQFLFFALDVEMNWLHLCLEKSTTFVNPL